jgi:hypothetical protein
MAKDARRVEIAEHFTAMAALDGDFFYGLAAERTGARVVGENYVCGHESSCAEVLTEMFRPRIMKPRRGGAKKAPDITDARIKIDGCYARRGSR